MLPRTAFLQCLRRLKTGDILNMNKIPSGVPGLDEVLGGGIPENRTILLSGTCGTGKTTLSMQFLMQSGPGIYISFEEDLDNIREYSRTFGWDLAGMEASGKLRLLQYDPFRLEDILEVIQNNIREIKARRIVFDSISSLGIYMKDMSELRRMILQTSSLMRKNKCTTMLVSEVLPNSRGLSRFGVEEFVSDGAILLDNVVSKTDMKRAISVWKMRGANHSRGIHPYSITENGIVIHKAKSR